MLFREGGFSVRLVSFDSRGDGFGCDAMRWERRRGGEGAGPLIKKRTET